MNQPSSSIPNPPRKRGWRFTLLLLGVGVALYGGARWYLSSSLIARQIGARLEGVLGVPVRVGSAAVGLVGTSSLSRLEIFESPGPGDATPWLSVDSLHADLSALDLLWGSSSPRSVDLSGANLLLRFDRDGYLLTRLPRAKGVKGGPVPPLHIDQGRLTLVQEGREPLILNGVRGEVADAEGGVHLQGSIEEPEWGQWQVHGDFQPDSGDVKLRLTCAGTHLNPDRLRRLPFISDAVWKQVRAEGDTPVEFALEFSTARPGVHYRVELQPKNTDVRVESINLNADHASGRLIVEDSQVTLRNVTGRTADGELALDAKFDFRTAVYRLDFERLIARHLVLTKLPKGWLPETLVRFGGSLTGSARLVVRIDEQGVTTSGEGTGEIKSEIAGGEGTIGLRLVSDGRRYHFRPVPKPGPLNIPPLAPVLGGEGSGVRGRTLSAFPPHPQPLSPEYRGEGGPKACLILPIVYLAPEPEPEEPSVPLWLAEQLPRGVGLLSRGIGRGASMILDRTRQLTKALSPGAPPSYLQASLKLDDVDLALLTRQLDLKLPLTLGGRMSIQVQVEMPVNTPNDYKAYRLRGSARAAPLEVNGFRLSELRGSVRLEEGLLRLEELKGTVPSGRAGEADGSFSGGARLQLFPLGDLDAELTVTRLPLNAALDRLPGMTGLVRGAVDGSVKLHAPAGRLSDPTTYDASGSLRAARLETAGLVLKDAAADLSLAKGVARVRNLKADLEGSPLTGSGELDLTRKSAPWNGQATLAGADLAALGRLSPTFRPPLSVEGELDVTAKLRGTLTPLALDAGGTIRARDLIVDRVRAGDVRAAWSIGEDVLTLSDFAAQLYRGSVSGTIRVPLTATRPGEINLQVRDLDLEPLTKALPSMPFRVTGRVSGKASGKLEAADRSGTRDGNLDLELTGSRVRVQNFTTTNVKAQVKYRDGGLDYGVTGDVLGGKFDLKGRLPPASRVRPARLERQDEPIPENGGRLRLTGLRLSQLSQTLGNGPDLEPLRGGVEVLLTWQYDEDAKGYRGTGWVRIRNLSWGTAEISERINADLRLTPRDLQLHNLTASLGEGALRGVISIGLSNRDRGWFSLSLERADSARVLAPFPSVAAVIQGPLEAQLRGSLGREWRGGGTVALQRGRVFGLEVIEWRLPVEFGLSIADGSGHLNVRDSVAQVGQGRVQGQATLIWASGLRLEGGLRFFNADLRSLLRLYGESSTLVGGRLSGRLDFAAANLRSENDLTATLDATLNETQALQLPVLNLLVPYLTPGRGTTSFQSGDVHARLSNGVVRVQRLRLLGSWVQLLIDGTVTLQGGRLNLDATARTGDLGVNPVGLRLVAQRIPAVGPIPVGLIAQASTLLANRLIHLRITGTVRNPVLRVEPLTTLPEEAVRFFLLQAYIPIPSG